MMIIGVYGTLGVFLLIASRNPYEHKSIIWFTVWSSVVHGAIMCVQSFNDAAERGHLIGDAPALLLVAIILATLMSRIDSPFEKGATAGLMETKGFTDQRGAAHLCAQTVIWLDWLSDKSCLVQKPRLEMTDNVRRCLNLHHRA